MTGPTITVNGTIDGAMSSTDSVLTCLRDGVNGLQLLCILVILSYSVVIDGDCGSCS
jgi:hypothetical protein